MGDHKTIPLAGIGLALITFAALLLLGVDPLLTVAVLVVWFGSLFLASSGPPESERVVVKKKFTRESMSALIENSSTPLLVTEGNRVAIANKAARQMLGQHILGQDARMAFRQPEAISLLSEDRNGRAIVRGLVRRRDIWQMNRQAVDDSLAVIELINQTAEADISRAHTDFVANASHELRTPLASIIGYVETLSESGDNLDATTSQRFFETILREAQRLQSLVSDLMSLSRVEAEKHDAPDQIVDLTSLVQRAAGDAAGPIHSDRLSLEVDEDIWVVGEVQQLEQMVRNLVDNAFKYGSSETPVEVSLKRSGDKQAKLNVTNDGEGIAAEHLPHLTRRFYRTDPGRSRASGGTGLGLAIVKHIVERHRGRLNIQSELNSGVSVDVTVPLASKRGQPNRK